MTPGLFVRLEWEGGEPKAAPSPGRPKETMKVAKSQIESRQSKIENDPMVRWPDRRGSPRCIRNKRS